ncbi:MAG: SurA N-terminal domain-containing protein [Myxococcota bacterium]|nr:SurA N-terminal domain-containing protein [Myxococcota bacterium]
MTAAKIREVLWPLLLGVALLAGSASEAKATIVERVVAVVGERPVLWTDVLRRAAPTRVQIRAQTHDANVVSVQEQEMYRELLERMIDDRVEEQQADKAHITISGEEIDRGIANIASQAQQQQGRAVTEQEVLTEVRRRGLTEQDFRDEIRRQILEGKLIELRVRPRVRVTDQDARAAYQHWARETKEQEPLDVRVLALRVGPQATRPQVDARMALAQELAAKVRAGGDFCQLVAEYTEDVGTRDSCGSRGPQPFASLLPPIQDAVRATKPGDVSDPVVVHIGAEDAIVILMPLDQPRVPEFEAVKNEMMQRALLEALERARKQWLQELRRNVYIDVRL